MTNSVNVSGGNQGSSINVSSGTSSGDISFVNNAAWHWSEVAKQWAISNTLVEGIDYSSKYYATMAKNASDVIVEHIDSIDAVVADLENIDTIVNNITDINIVGGSIANVNSVASDLTNIDLVAADLTNIDDVAEGIINVNSVANDLTNIDAVADNLSDISDLLTNMSDINSVAEDLTNINAVSDDLTNIDSVVDNATNINTVAGSISNVNAVGGSIVNVNSVASNLTNITAVNNNATNINTVAGMSSNISSVVNNALNINAVAGDLTNINAVKTDLTNIDSVADNLTNITAVKNNTSNINSVASNISNVNTVAGSILSVNTVASNIADVTAVKNNATNINTVATNISNVNTVGGSISNVNSVAGDLTNINAVAADLTNIDNASNYANLAEDWANKMDGTVDGVEYSAKYYAQQSSQGQVQANWSETDTTAKSYIQNKPTIPTVNNATLTIQKNGTNVETFTANASSNKTANITVPTKTSDLTNDSNFATTSQIPTNNNQLTNGAGYITGINSSDVTTALGYTPYDSSNPNGYTSNVGTVTSVNNVQPVNGNVTLTLPDPLPSQTGQSGKYLTTNGTNASWGEISVNNKVNTDYIDLIPAGTGSNIGTFNYENGLLSAGQKACAQIPTMFDPQTSSWEIAVRFMLTSKSGTGVILYAYQYGINLHQQSQGIWLSVMTGQQSSFIIRDLIVIRSSSLQANVYYTVKIKFDGIKYEVYVDDTLVHTENSTATIGGAKPIYLTGFPATSSGINEKLPGYIDLTQTYIKINDSYWWRGVYEAKNVQAIREMIDGQWVISYLQLLTGDTTLTANTTYTYSLSSYLPADGYSYEVLFAAAGTTQATANKTVKLCIGSSYVPDNRVVIAGANTLSNTAVWYGGNTTIPIGTDRNVTIRNDQASNCQCWNFSAIGYRRIGTNA